MSNNTNQNQDIVSYTSKTYQTILNDITEKIPLLTDKWVNYGENDPGIVLLKLVAATADMLCYNMDFQARENFPHLATMRSNVQKSYDLINYKMKWYESAVTEVELEYIAEEGQPGYVIIPNYCQLYTNENLIFTIIDNIDNRTVYTNNKTRVKAVQGMLCSKSGITIDSLIDTRRIYLGYNEVDCKHIDIESYSTVTNQKIDAYSWTLVDDLETILESGRFFEFGVDDNGNAYIQLCEDYAQYMGKQYLKVNFIRTDGYDGNIGPNVLTRYGTVIPDSDGNTLNQSVHILSNTSTINGCNPETLKDSLVNARIYSSILDSAVTISDFAELSATADRIRKCRCLEININDPYVRHYKTKDNFPENNIDESASNKALYVDDTTELCYRLINNSDGTTSYERVDLIIQIVTDEFGYPSTNMQNEIDTILIDKKTFCVNQGYSTAFTEVIPYNVIIYYEHPYTEVIETSIKEKVLKALNGFYDSIYREFGEFIKYKEVVKEVEGCSDMIDYSDILSPKGNVQVDSYRYPRLGPVNVVLSDNPNLEIVRTVLEDSINAVTEEGRTITLTNRSVLTNSLFAEVVALNQQGANSDKDFSLPDTELAQYWTFYLRHVETGITPTPLYLTTTKVVVLDDEGRLIVNEDHVPISEKSEIFEGNQTLVTLEINWYSSREDIISIVDGEVDENPYLFNALVQNTQYPEEVEIKVYPMIGIGSCKFSLEDKLNLIKRGATI